MIKVINVKKHCGHGMEAPLDEIIKDISPNLNYTIQLSESDKVIFLNVPHSGLYHKCTDDEWIDVKCHIIKTLPNIEIRSKKRSLLDSIFHKR